MPRVTEAKSVRRRSSLPVRSLRSRATSLLNSAANRATIASLPCRMSRSPFKTRSSISRTPMPRLASQVPFSRRAVVPIALADRHAATAAAAVDETAQKPFLGLALVAPAGRVAPFEVLNAMTSASSTIRRWDTSFTFHSCSGFGRAVRLPVSGSLTKRCRL